jgi:DNA-binding NtrC family response regulator
MRLLLVEDEPNFTKILMAELPAAWEKHAVSRLQDAKQILREKDFDVAVLDLKLPDGEGLELVSMLQHHLTPPEVLVLTGHGSVQEAVRAMRMGVSDFITKPIGLEKLESLIRAAALRRDPSLGTATNEYLADFLPPSLRALGQQVLQLAATDIPILILGESGVGKDRFAQFVRLASSRAAQPMVALNCASIPENLLESELFGYEKGAFTGAHVRKQGLLQTAHQGTIFLDEIAELSMVAQAKLLRFLDTGEFYRVGSVTPSQVDVRLISATHCNLEKAIEDGKFREDFFFRINGYRTCIPPLRERPSDIEFIARAYFTSRKVKVHDDAMEMLIEYRWPGNVRELLLRLQRIEAVLGGMRNVTVAHVGQALDKPLSNAHTADDLSLETATLRHIRRVMRLTDGNRAHAARLLGIDPKTLYRKLKDAGDIGPSDEND